MGTMSKPLQTPSPGRCIRQRAAACLPLAIAAVAMVVSHAQGQQYKTDPVDPKARNHGAIVQLCLRNPADLATNKAQFDEYFNAFYFPEMTQTSEANLGRLGDMRYNLFKRYLWATTDPGIQSALTNLSFNYMKNLVGGSM